MLPRARRRGTSAYARVTTHWPRAGRANCGSPAPKAGQAQNTVFVQSQVADVWANGHACSGKIQNKTTQAQQKDDTPDDPRHNRYVFILKIFCHRYQHPFLFGFRSQYNRISKNQTPKQSTQGAIARAPMRTPDHRSWPQAADGEMSSARIASVPGGDRLRRWLDCRGLSIR